MANRLGAPSSRRRAEPEQHIDVQEPEKWNKDSEWQEGDRAAPREGPGQSSAARGGSMKPQRVLAGQGAGREEAEDGQRVREPGSWA